MAGKQARKLNEALRGERAALESYTHVLDAMEQTPYLEQLRIIASQHRQAIEELEKLVLSESDGEPDHGSGAWGGMARIVTSAATKFGESTALKALRQGEEHGLIVYEEMVEDRHLDESLRKRVETEFIPQQVRHISVLDVVLDQVS